MPSSCLAPPLAVTTGSRPHHLFPRLLLLPLTGLPVPSPAPFSHPVVTHSALKTLQGACCFQEQGPPPDSLLQRNTPCRAPARLCSCTPLLPLWPGEHLSFSFRLVSDLRAYLRCQLELATLICRPPLLQNFTLILRAAEHCVCCTCTSSLNPQTISGGQPAVAPICQKKKLRLSVVVSPGLGMWSCSLKGSINEAGKETEKARKFPVSIATERMQHYEQRGLGWECPGSRTDHGIKGIFNFLWFRNSHMGSSSTQGTSVND